MTTTVVVVSDLHINSTVALCTPSINLDDGGTYKASKAQRWLWNCWLDMWEHKIPLLSVGDKILIINGDMADIDIHKRSHQIISRNNATIQSMVLDTIEPAIDWANRIYIIRGTAAHNGKSAWLEEAIAQDLDNTVQDSNSASWWHLRSTCDGVKFDIAHHASMGNLPHTSANAANKVAFLAQYRYKVDMGQPAPDIAIRSHNHRYADSGGNYKTFAILTGAWTIATEHVYRIGQENTLADINANMLVCDNGTYKHTRIDYDYPEVKRIWKKKM
jgi:hypothetical protein